VAELKLSYHYVDRHELTLVLGCFLDVAVLLNLCF